MKLYVVFKRKGAKEWLGALPARPNATKAKLQAMLKDQLRAGFVARVISEPMLKRIMVRQGVSMKRKSKSSVRRPRRRVRKVKRVKRRMTRRPLRRVRRRRIVRRR